MELDERKWDEPQWVAVYTHARAEKRLAENLTKHGFETYLPLHRQLHKWSDRKKWVEVPLFSSYVFVKIIGKQVAPLRDTDGVVYIVNFGNSRSIAWIPQKEIDNLRRLMESEQEFVVKNAQQLKRGSKVKILSGAMEGMEGVLVSDCEDGNFAVEVTSLSASIVWKLEIQEDMLEYIEDDKSTKKGIWEKKK